MLNETILHQEHGLYIPMTYVVIKSDVTFLKTRAVNDLPNLSLSNLLLDMCFPGALLLISINFDPHLD